MGSEARVSTEEQLEDLLSRPTASELALFERLKGDLILLGAGGKMGPSLARRAVRAVRESQVNRRVIAVARFTTSGLEEQLRSWGVETIAADLLAPGALDLLPDAANVIFMAARKFGTAGDEPGTWAINSFLPGLVAQRYRGSRIVTWSTGNVYALTPVPSGGAVETTTPAPVGEYAQSALARERIFEFFSRRDGTSVAILRLNYAVELRYGVLVDIGLKVSRRHPIDLSMPALNCIWQGDANSICLRSLELCDSPPRILNVTGQETLRVREIADAFGAAFGAPPVFVGHESGTALLSNAAECFRVFRPATVPLGQLIEWTADWISCGGRLLEKPTHFEIRDGRF